MGNEAINILGLVVGPIIAIFVGYLYVRGIRRIVKTQEGKDEAKTEPYSNKPNVVGRVVLQALLSYPYAFYVLVTELSSTEPVTRSSIYFISLSIGIIILGVLLNAITITFASSNHLFTLILSSMQRGSHRDKKA